jgi:hypothetical protein
MRKLFTQGNFGEAISAFEQALQLSLISLTLTWGSRRVSLRRAISIKLFRQEKSIVTGSWERRVEETTSPDT